MASKQLLSEMQISNIDSNKLFSRLAKKAQVSSPTEEMPEVVRTRHSHSYEVGTSASITAFSIEERKGWPLYTVDFEGSLKPACLLHDVGHPSFGHPGSDLLNDYFKDLGVPEGFCDNNNTLTVIEKNDIMVSSYTVCSVIKYPEKLYPEQVKRYQNELIDAIELDRVHFESHGLKLKPQTRTIACQIMDEADRNTYICSDLSDFLCIGNTLPVDALKAMAKNADLAYRYSELNNLFSTIRSGDKKTIKSYFNNLKNSFNMNFDLTENGIEVIDADLHQYREFLWDVEFEFYITPIRKEAFHLNSMKKMEEYIDKVVIDGFAPSRTYSKKIDEARKNNDRLSVLRAQRDMIAETTDEEIVLCHSRGTEFNKKSP